MKQGLSIPAVHAKALLTCTDECAADPRARQQGRPSQPRPVGRSPQQGIALEMLAHAIDYLVDTNFYRQRACNSAVSEAVAILEQGTQDVLAMASPMLPPGERAARWLRSQLRPEPVVAESGGPARLTLVKR